MARVGVLALQGDFEAHARVLARCAVDVLEVRRCAELEALDALIVPGGESTTLLNLMADEPWFEALRSFHASGGALLGTCAGAILLSKDVLPRGQESLGLLDATIERNAYGRQVDSFETRLEAPALGGDIEAVFIRAPRFVRLGPGVEVIARHAGEPVLVREGRVFALTFHPELTADDRLHRWFVNLVAGRRESAAPARAAAR
jgi:5'-phosphate synthase pdxT subunit